MATLEQFTNNAVTSLSAAITTVPAPGTSENWTVVSASGFPPTAQYRIIIDSEIMIVTAGAGGTTWTVTRGAESTVVTTHVAGSVVAHILTAGSLLAAGRTYDVRAYGATGNGTTVDTTAVQAAIDDCSSAGGGTVFFPAGNYLVTDLALKSNVHLAGDGYGSVLKSNGSGSYIVLVRGTVGTGATLSANGVEGQWTVSTGTNNPVLATGDIVYISDSTTDNAELNRVVSVAGTNPYVVTLHASLINDYATASTAQIRKLNAVINTSIENIRLWGNGTTNGGVWYEYAYDCDVRTAWFTGIYGTALLYFNSAHMTVNDCDMRDGTDNTNNSYGMNVASSSHHGLFTNNYSENLREHAFGTGAKHHVFAHNTMRNHYDDGVNTHGNGASRVTFASNLVSGVQAGHGIVVGQSVGTAADSYVSVIGNIVEECNQSGIYVAGGTSAITHHVLVADNIVRRNGRQANGANPQINVYAGATAAFLTDIEVRDNIVSGIASVDTGRLIYVSGGTNVRIAGNHCDTAFNEYGIQQDGASTNNSITDNLIRNVDSNNIRTVATNTGMLVARNRSDDTDFTRAAGEMWRDNIWGTTQSRNFGSAAITTGSTIAHGLVTTPTAWGATFIITGMSNLFITADATNLTVNWTGGGTQTVKWWAEV